LVPGVRGLQGPEKNEYSPESDSKDSGTDSFGYESAGFAVNVNWNADTGQWNVNAYRRDDNYWNAGNRAFSRNSSVSPAPHGAGVFD
jgi:hypothetical protein